MITHLQKCNWSRSYTTGCLLDYNYFNSYFKKVIDLSNNKHLILIQKQYNK